MVEMRLNEFGESGQQGQSGLSKCLYIDDPNEVEIKGPIWERGRSKLM